MLDLYRKRMGQSGNSYSNAMKNQSNTIMNQTFKNGVSYRRSKIDGEYVDTRFFSNSQLSITGDSVDYKLQFRPHIKYPLGTYISIPSGEHEDEYEDWLSVGESDDTMFPKYNILKCNYEIKWIDKGKILCYKSALRVRNSYSSGIWSNNFMVTLDNQIAVWLPSNQDVKTIQYGTRFLITYNEIHPVSYKVTKVEDAIVKGISKLTLLQDEVSAYDNTKLMIADYYKFFPKNVVEDVVVDDVYKYQIVGKNSIIINSEQIYNLETTLNGKIVDSGVVEYKVTDVNGDDTNIVEFESVEDKIIIKSNNLKGTIVIKAIIDSNVVEREIKVKGLL